MVLGATKNQLVVFCLCDIISFDLKNTNTMPKFYCTHCGQHIDAPDELAGSHLACPTCGGEIDVPALEELTPFIHKAPPQPTPPPIQTKKKTAFWSARSLKATLGAGGLCLLGTLIRPSTAMERMGFSDRGFATILGETLGAVFAAGLIALVIALVIAGIMSAFKKRFAESLSRSYSIGVLVVAGLALVGNLFSRSNTPSYSSYPKASEIESARNTITGLEDDIQSLIAESVGPDGLPRKTDMRFDSNTPTSDDMGRLRELIQSFFNDMIELQNDYLQALEVDGIDTLLDANRVARDTGFTESRRTLVRVKRTVADTRSKASRILGDFPERIKDYEFSATSDRKMLEGYQKSLKNALPLFKEMWDLEVEAVEHMEDLIDHLEVTRMYWEPDQGMFMFERDRDLERFNSVMGKITNCVDRQTEIREKSLKSATDKIDNLKDMIPE